MNKTVTSIRVGVDEDVTLSRYFNALELGPTVARQRAASYATTQHALGRSVSTIEYYSDGTCYEFKSR